MEKKSKLVKHTAHKPTESNNRIRILGLEKDLLESNGLLEIAWEIQVTVKSTMSQVDRISHILLAAAECSHNWSSVCAAEHSALLKTCWVFLVFTPAMSQSCLRKMNFQPLLFLRPFPRKLSVLWEREEKHWCCFILMSGLLWGLCIAAPDVWISCCGLEAMPTDCIAMY